jgi:cysteinyl-tRNA synthetase
MGIARPLAMPRATEFIGAMVEDIGHLIERGAAYSVPDGSVYFRAHAFPGYGLLSHQNMDGIRAGARVEPDPAKEDEADFALWKGERPGEPKWPAPWGAGRPGWHMECTTMADRVLGRPIDIHGGGADLIFPHHENERAQAEALRSEPFVRMWLHAGMLMTGGSKAAKSLGNVGPLRAMRQEYEPMALRMFFLTAHYAHPLNLTDEALGAARSALVRVREVATRARGELRQNPDRSGSEAADAALDQAVAASRGAFDRALQDDLNAPIAQAGLFELGRLINQAVGDGEAGAASLARALGAYLDMWQVLGIAVEGEESRDENRVARVERLVAARQAARQRRDFAEADRLRDAIKARGYQVEDTPEGSVARAVSGRRG